MIRVLIADDHAILRRSPVVIELDETRAVKWEYSATLKGTTQSLRATAVGEDGQTSDRDSSPIVSVDIPE